MEPNANSFQLSELPLLGKGLGDAPHPLTRAQVAAQGWHLLREDVSLPVAVLRQSAMAHNLAWMQAFTTAYRLKLAPHGKTSMCPALFQLQLEAGAWGITLATAPQVQAAYAHGVRQVLMANQLVGQANMAIIARLLRDPGFSFHCLVDSAANVAALGEHFEQAGLCLPVLLEIGLAGGRTGVRDDAQMEAVLAELARWPRSLRLAGVEVYEGVASDEAQVRALLQRSRQVFESLCEAGRFNGTAILSGAGSAWFDVVAEEFAPLAGRADVDIVLRPGCYLTHDVGSYAAAARRMQASNPVVRGLGEGLRPALQVWAQVQSRPEPSRVIVGLGKRDAAFDAGYPTPALYFRPGMAAPLAPPEHWQVTAMMDQHAFLQVEAGDDLAVGDLIGFDICHPCLTFDKWRHLLVVDDDYRVVDALPTFF